MNHEISVIVPVYGRPGLARDAVESALAQHGVGVDLIVVDDGSVEPMEDLRNLVLSAGGRFVSTAHRGIAHARNVGAKLSRADWLAFLDSDDLYYPTKLETQLRHLRLSAAAWSVCGYHLTSEDRRVLGTELLLGLAPEFWRETCPAGATSVVVDRRLFEHIGGFDESFTVCEDWDLFIRLGEHSAPALVGQPMYAYRLGCGNVSASRGERWGNAWNQLARKHEIDTATMTYLGMLTKIGDSATTPALRRAAS